jgi:L-tyrosine peroxygenase
MTSTDDGAVIDSVPRSAAWEFGGHRYGLEPMALPRTGQSPVTTGDEDRILRFRALLETIVDGHGLSGDEAAAMRPGGPADVDRIFWFRWITGHQATFVIWQLLAAVLTRVSDHDPRGRASDLEPLAAEARLLLRGYSLMLLYTASVPQEIYGRVIRAWMARQHPNLSGAWARDYGPIRPLLHGKIDFGGGRQAEALREECAVNERVHEGVSLKLVPSGVSLFEAGNVNCGAHRLSRENLQWLYDGVFLTNRAPLRYSSVFRQLLRRLHAISLDLAANDLYPSFAPSRHEAPLLLLAEDIEDRVRDFKSTILDIATLPIATSLVRS